MELTNKQLEARVKSLAKELIVNNKPMSEDQMLGYVVQTGLEALEECVSDQQCSITGEDSGG